MNDLIKIEILAWMDENQALGTYNIFEYPSMIKQIWDISRTESRNIFIEWRGKQN